MILQLQSRLLPLALAIVALAPLAGCHSTPNSPPAVVKVPDEPYMHIKRQKVQLTAHPAHKGQPIADKLLSDKEGLQSHSNNSYVLFFKKSFKEPTNVDVVGLKVRKAWYKPFPSGTWAQTPKQLIDRCDFRVLGGTLEPQYEHVKGNVTEVSLDDVPPGMWRLDCDVTVNFESSDINPDGPDPEYEGHAHFIAEAARSQSGLIGNPVELHKAWISHLEWGPTLNGPWKKIPEAGQPGFPLHVKQPLNIYVRAARLYPKDPWPTQGFDAANTGEELPTWSGMYRDSHFTPEPLLDHIRIKDTVNLQSLQWSGGGSALTGHGLAGSGDNDHLMMITAKAGSSKSAQLFIEP